MEPVIRHLDVNDAELQQRIQVEISNLYEFFKRLYDQDQMEIRWAVQQYCSGPLVHRSLMYVRQSD